MPRNSCASATTPEPRGMSNAIESSNSNRNWPDTYRPGAEQAKDARIRDFYNARCPDAATPVRDVPLVALDCETTRLDVNKHSIVSFGLVPLTLGDIQLGDAWHQIVRQQPPLEPD